MSGNTTRHGSPCSNSTTRPNTTPSTDTPSPVRYRSRQSVPEEFSQLAGAVRAYDDLLRADLYLGLAATNLRNHQYDAARTCAAKAYDAVAMGAREAGVDVARSEAEAREKSRAARAESPAHPNGLYVDTEHGPRSQP